MCSQAAKKNEIGFYCLTGCTSGMHSESMCDTPARNPGSGKIGNRTSKGVPLTYKISAVQQAVELMTAAQDGAMCLHSIRILLIVFA